MDVDIARIQVMASALKQQTEAPQDVARVFRLSAIRPSEIAPPAETCNAHVEARFIRNACDVLGDITFAARTRLQVTSASTLTAYISKYSRDLGQVMENTTRFHRFIDPALAFRMRISGNFASLEADWKDASFSRYHRRTEFLMFAAVARMRNLTATRLCPIEIRFQHPAGHHERAFNQVGGFPVVFNAEKLEIVLPLPALDTPVPTYDPRLREHLLEYGERLLAEHVEARQSLRSKIEGMITRSLPGSILRAEDAARELNMSPRTMARRLGAEGCSFREIVDDLRCDLAQTFLRDGMTLAETSFALGYADQAAFSTAFKRWTGQAPGGFRTRIDRQASK